MTAKQSEIDNARFRENASPRVTTWSLRSVQPQWTLRQTVTSIRSFTVCGQRWSSDGEGPKGMPDVFMCDEVDHGALMQSRLRFTIYFGVVIPIICTSTCTAQNAPAFHVGEYKLQYALDASESVILSPGQRHVYSCLEAVVPGARVQWLKDNVEVGSGNISPLPIANKHTSKSLTRRALSHGAHFSRKSRLHSGKHLEDEQETKISGGDQDSRMQRRLSSVSDTKYTPHNVTGLPQSLPHDSTALAEDSYFSDEKYFLYENGSLCITKLTDTSAGEYQCFVSDNFGSFLRRKFNLRIADMPQCSIKPTSQQPLNGTTARFECLTVSALNVNYTWLKDGLPLPQKSNSKYTFLSTGVLQIFDIEATDLGWYACQASSTVGSCVSENASLTILPNRADIDALHFLHPPQNLSLMPHENAVFECMASSSQVLYGWTKRDGLICPDPGCHEKVTPRLNNLLLNSISPSRSGFYTCQIRGSNQKFIESTSYLDILEKPRVTISPGRTKKVVFSETVHLACSLMAGNPKPNVYWMKDGVVVPEDRVKIYGQGEQTVFYLDIATIRRDDIGYYQCIAENKVGAVSAGVRLALVIKERVPPPYNVTAVARSAREVLVEWKRPNTTKRIIAYTVEYDNRKINVNGSKTSVSLSNLKPYTTYMIKVLAYTSKQTSEESQPAIVQTGETEPCGEVKNMKAVEVNSSTVLVTWPPLPKEEQCGVITFYKVISYDGDDDIQMSMNVPAREGKTEYAVLTGLSAGHNYGISITAATGVGLGGWSDFVDLNVPETPAYTCSTTGAVIHSINGRLSTDGDVFIVEWKCLDHPNIKSVNVSVTDDRGITQSQNLLHDVMEAIFVPAGTDRVYIGKVNAISANGSICEKHSFVVEPSDRTERPLKLATDLDGNATSPGCIRLTWKYVSEKNETLGFSVRYSLDDPSPHENNERYVNSSTTCTVICSLETWSGYTFAVAVISKTDRRQLKNSDYSKEKTIWTAEEPPGMPKELRCVPEKVGKVFCKWQQPIKPNGEIQGYIVFYRDDSLEEWSNLTTRGRFALLDCMPPGSTYVFHVSAVNVAGVGECSVDEPVAIPKYEAASTNCTFASFTNDEDGGDDDHTKAVIVGVTIAAVCLFICVVLLVCCVPTSRCVQNEKRFGLRRKKKNSNQRQGHGTNKREEVILVGSAKTSVHNRRIIHVELNLSEEQSERLLPNGDVIRPNGNPINGLKNGYAEVTLDNENGFHKITPTPADNCMDHSSVVDGLIKNDPTHNTRIRNGRSGSLLFDSFVRSLTMKNRPAAIPEADRKIHSQMVLSVPIPKHTSRMGIYATSSMNAPQSDTSDITWLNSSGGNTSDLRHLSATGMQNRNCSTSKLISNGGAH